MAFFRGQVLRNCFDGPRRQVGRDVRSCIKISRGTRSSYVAGLWERNLVEELLWELDSFNCSTGRFKYSSKYRAPTFSWASVDVACPVRFPNIPSFESGATLIIHEVDCTLEEPHNPLGQVTEAHIRVTGCLVGALLDPLSTSDVIFALRLQNSDASSYHTDVEFKADGRLVTSSAVQPFGKTALRSLNDSCIENSTPVSCLWVAGEPLKPWSSYRDYFLVLGHSVRRPGAFERLGCIKIDRSEGNEDVETTEYLNKLPRQTITIV